MNRIFLAFMALSASDIVSADSGKRYITGSYVNIRTQPSKDAKVIDHLTINAPVTLLTQATDFCEISWGDSQKGFVACNLLGEQSLRIEDIGAKYLLDSGKQPIRDQNGLPQPDPRYSPLRAFWIEPTIERLFDAGEHFRQIALPTDQLNEENEFISKGGGEKVPNLKRFPLPEFEAMKTLLISGLIAPRSQYIPPTAWKNIQALNKKPDAADTLEQFRRISRGLYFENSQDYVKFYQQISLPTAKPSFFKAVEAIGRPADGTEALSAQYQIPFQMSVLDKPKWGGDNNSYPLLIGAWDIGTVSTTLTKPVYEIAIGIDGQLSVGETTAPAKNSMGDDQQYCTQEFRIGTTRNLLPGFKKISHPWIFLRLDTPPALTKAKVVIKKINNDIDYSGGNVFFGTNLLQGKLSIARIDLDKDTVDDLIVWDNGGIGSGLEYNRKRLIFANLAGQWYLLDYDEEHACNC